MKRAVVGVVVLLLVAGVAVRAQAPKPYPELQKLQPFVGDWVSEGEDKSTPLGPAGKTTGKSSAKWILDGFYLQWEFLVHHRQGASVRRAGDRLLRPGQQDVPGPVVRRRGLHGRCLRSQWQRHRLPGDDDRRHPQVRLQADLHLRPGLQQLHLQGRGRDGREDVDLGQRRERHQGQGREVNEWGAGDVAPTPIVSPPFPGGRPVRSSPARCARIPCWSCTTRAGSWR